MATTIQGEPVKPTKCRTSADSVYNRATDQAQRAYANDMTSL